MIGTALTLLTLGAPAFSWTVGDPRGDDRGPGTYQYPSGDVYPAGSFDLRRFTVRVEGDAAVFEVELAAPIRRPVEVRLSDATLISLDNNLYVQNVDIYVDRDPAGGVVEAIPGRRVRFEAESAWDTAIVLTPQPYVVRSGLDDWAPGRGRVLVPTDVRSQHRTVRATVPLTDLGGVPDATWGFQVLLSGAVWQASFDAFRRVAGGYQPNALTMKVTTISEPTAFGGGELGDYHPFVIDLLAPRGLEQGQILRGYDAMAERWAAVPMVYVDPIAHQRRQAARPAPAASAPPGPPAFLERGLVPIAPWVASATAAMGAGPIVVQVQSIDGDIVVLSKPDRPLKRFQLGAVFGPGGEPMGRVVLDQEYPAFMLATAVEGVGRIRAGATVRFDPPKE